MRAELQRMGLSLEWEREFATCDPEYYGHQQKLFLDFLRAGLVERKESWVNWDPVDGTVLANEQVIDGRGWRSGAPVEKKQLQPVVPEDHRLCAGAAGRARYPGSLARTRAADAGEMDRPQRGRAAEFRAGGASGRHRGGRGLHHAAGHAVRHVVPGAGAGASAVRRGGGARSEGGRVRRRMPPDGHLRGGDRDGREAGLRHRAARAAPVPGGRRPSRCGSPTSC